jgi:plasmid maintenance system antidote protein VapI
MVVIYITVLKKKRNPTLTELLRQSLAEAESLRGVARATGLKHPSLLKFLRGEQSLRLDLADKLAEHFGIESHRPKKRR